MAENDVLITVSVDAKDAQAAIELFGKNAVKSVNQVEKATESFGQSFSSLVGPVGKAVAVIATAYATLSKGISEAVQDQKLILQVNAALQSTGELSKEASENILEYADSLSQATAVSDDLIKQAFITAKAFGVTNEQAKKLTAASLDYAAATGIDVESAVQRLGQTFDGTVGKIGNLGAEFRNLTTDQLKNGAAIDLITQKYAGAAAAQSDTFEGSTRRLSKAIDDLFKAFGKIVVESPAIIEAITNIASAINFVAESVPKIISPLKEYQKSLDLKNAEKFVAQNELIGNSSQEAAQGFASIVKESEKLTSSSKSVETFAQKIELLSPAVTKVGELTGKAAEDAAKAAKKAAEDAARFIDGINASVGSSVEQQAFKTQDLLKKLSEFESSGAISTKSAYELRLKIVEDFNKKVASENERAIKEEQDAINKGYAEAAKAAADFKAQLVKDAADARAEIEKSAAQPIKFVIDQKAAGKELTGAQGAGIGVGLISSALKGKGGALDLVSQGIGGIADTIIPGLGGAVAGLAQLLAQGPEATKKFIREFVESIPDIIIAIAESIPVVVEAFVDAMINKGGAARIAIAIAKAMVFAPTWAAIGKQLGTATGKEMAKPFEDAGKQFADDSSSFGSNISGAFKQFVKDVGPSIGKGLADLGPALSSGIQEGLANFIGSIEPFFNGLFDAITSAFSGFFDGMSNLFAQFPQQLLDAVTNIASALVAPFATALAPVTSAILPLTDAINGLLGPINDLISALKGGRGGGQGVIAETLGKVADIPVFKQIGDAVSGIGSALGFAKGGVVPLYAADGAFVPRGTDTVPAMLTPGELVVPRDLVGELGQFLAANANSGGPTAQDAMLAQILGIVSAPVVVQSEVKVNQNAFADIILQLNRQNARLTA